MLSTDTGLCELKSSKTNLISAREFISLQSSSTNQLPTILQTPYKTHPLDNASTANLGTQQSQSVSSERCVGLSPVPSIGSNQTFPSKPHIIFTNENVLDHLPILVALPFRIIDVTWVASVTVTAFGVQSGIATAKLPYRTLTYAARLATSTFQKRV